MNWMDVAICLWHLAGVAIGLLGLSIVLSTPSETITVGSLSLTGEARAALYTFITVDNSWRLWTRMARAEA